MIWGDTYDVETLNKTWQGDHIVSLLGIEFIDIRDDYLKARMPVDSRTHQPHGLLHGGATCVLAETLGSVASLLVIDMSKNYAVGSFITANHLRPVREGYVDGICRPVHLGRSKHVWDITVQTPEGKTVAKCELTCAVTPKRS